MGRIFFSKKIFRVWLYALALFIMLIFSSLIPQAYAQSDFYKNLEFPFYDPNSSGACDTTVLSGSDPEEQIWNYFVAKGLSDQQTAGIMGNIQQESSFSPIRMQIGGYSKNPYDAGTEGWGLIQWSGNNEPTGDKITSLYKDSGLTGPIYELATQLDLIWGHMQNKPPITKGDFSLSDFKNITDEKQAAQYFLAHIEAGTDPIDPKTGQPIREENASNILEKYSGTTGGEVSDSSGSCDVSISSGNCNANGIVYSAEYSQQQLAAIFGDPGTASAHPAMDANLVSTDFMGYSVHVNKLVAPCLEAVAADIKSNNIDYKITDAGCYRYDSDNGSSNIGLSSYHTYGAACDINPHTNNYYDTGNNGTQPYDPNCPAASGVVDSGHCYDMSPQIVKIFAAHGFYWGGNYHTKKDYMHFEWHGIVPQ